MYTASVKNKLTGIFDILKNIQMMLKSSVKHNYIQQALSSYQREWIKLIIPMKSYVYFNKGTHFANCPYNIWQNKITVNSILAVYFYT